MNPIKEQFAIVAIAVSFLTRLPVPKRLTFSQDRLNKASGYFPLVGLLIGVAGAFMFWGAQYLLDSSLIAAVLSTAATVLLTGAFHEDGFADMCDGFGGAFDVETKLEIMKDSRVGTYGLLGLGLMVSTKIIAISELALPSLLIFAHCWSRASTISLMTGLDYVRLDETSKVKPIAKSLSTQSIVVAVLIAVCSLTLLPLAIVVPVLLVTVSTRWCLVLFYKQQIGGYTGDCLGAAQQVFEVLTYLTALTVLRWPV